MKYNLTLFVAAILLCAGAFAALYITKNKPAPPPQASEAHFDASNLQRMLPDTLARLARQAYGDSMNAIRKDDELRLRWNAGSTKPSAFYNNNEDLTAVRGHGFTLRTEGAVLYATFRIYKDSTVQVPNDILLALISRIPNVSSP